MAGAALLVVAGVAVFGATLVRATIYAPEMEAAAPQGARVAAATSTLPVRLQIPALHIDANVQAVGVKVDGSMGTPNNFTDVAWYKYGIVPGQLGVALIDGHVDNGLSLPGVFKHLGDIKTGDDVYILERDGSRLHFVVTGVQTYPYQNVPMQEIAAPRDAPRLDIITCEGAWVSSGKTYDRRLVVFTDLAAS